MTPPLTPLSTSSTPVPPHQVTEDTPVDYLEGCMEILVVFPNEKCVPMSIQRRMPMLDLLIHVTAANKIAPSSHVLQVCDENRRLLAHMPSTPIGSLNAHTVFIVPKNRLVNDRSNPSATRFGNKMKTLQPFEPTFRLQVRLPQSQLFVTRVTARTQLKDLLHTICNEKNLDPSQYELCHPVNVDERLRLNSCLDDYKLQEIVVVSKERGGPLSLEQQHSPSKMSSAKAKLRGAVSSTSEAADKKKRGGFLGKFFGKSKKGSSMGDSSVSSDSAGDRSISPSRWEEPAPPTPPTAASNSPTPPSPVLVSKRLAEEAVLKRNSQLLIKEEASSRTSKTSPQMINGRPAITRTTAKSTKKRPAPLPPGHQRAPEVSSHLHPPSPATAVSAASASSRSSAASGRYGLPVSSSSEKPESARLSAPTTYSNYSPNLSATMAYHPPSSSASHSASGGMNGSRYHSTSNLESTPSVSISNLTHVSSSSNGSLASAIRKRKAPGPPSITEKDPSAPRQRMANLINPAWGSESVASDDVELKPEAAENVPVVKASASPTSSTRRDVVSKGADSDEETEVETETEAGATGKAEGEEDYEVLDFQRKAGIADEECCQANSQVEVVKPEPLYTMVVKSPKSIRATDVHKEDIRLPASAQSDSDYSIREEANPTESAQLPDEPEVVGGIAEVSAESPILWEYKLPAPPPAFTDTVTSHSSTAPEDTSTSGSTSDADSSISIDSLQIENRTDVELKPEVPLATVKMDDKPEVRPESIEANAQPEELQEATQVAGPKPEVVVDSVEKEMKPEVVVDPVEKEMKPEVRQEPIQTECKREEEAQPVQVEVKPETKAKPEHKDLKPEEKNGSLMMNFKPKRSVLNEFIPLGSIVVDCKPEVLVEPIQHPHPETLTLNEGSDLQGETTTEDAVSTNEAPEAEASLPPCSPSRLDDEEELESPQELPDKPEMRFSISTYHRRVKKEGLSYDKKLIRSESFSTTQQPKTRTLTSTGSLDTPTPTPMLTSDTTSSQLAQPIQPLPVTTLPSPDQPVKDTEPEIVAETEQPEVTEAVPAAVPVSLPISVDLIQQFQNALHNTSDPGARALQEEFLRLQQQFLTWQTQAALQQQSTASTASADDPSPKDPRPVAAPSATPLAASAAHELSPIEEVSMESSVGSPEREQDQSTPVKVETWQAGRPQSTVVDHSRSAVFSALKTDPAPILETQPIPAAQTVQPIPSPRSIIPSTDDKTDPAEVPELDPTPVNTPETEVTNDDTAVRNNLPVVRKASFLTARPFDPNRPVQFPIKRPNFSPMVIHPVPAVSRRFHQPNGRAPEVRGFASIPYSDGEPPAEKQTMFIRNQLIQSAKRPSGEWHTNGQEVQLRNSLHKEPVEEANEEKPPRPFSMPVSSSLLLAAARNGTPSPPPPPPPPPTTTIHEDDPVSILSLKRVSLRPVDANGRGGRPQSVPPKFETEINPRDQLLQSIRDFGHNGTLRKMGTDPN